MSTNDLNVGRANRPRRKASARWRVAERANRLARETRMIPPVLAMVAFMAGLVVKPDTLTSHRVGYGIVVDANACRSLEDCANMGFPSGLFGFIKVVVPFAPDTLLGWDTLLAAVGAVVVFSFALWVSRCPVLSPWQIAVFVAAAALSAIYVFMLSKDVIQVFVFLVAFVLVRCSRNEKIAVALAVIVFAAEGLVWRRYYYIVAAFIPLVYVIYERLSRGELTGKRVFAAIAALVVAMLVFSVSVKVISPDSYAEIVHQHSEDRESYTATAAASGIESVMAIDDASPVYLFVANWCINIVRLLFPVELFAKGPYYWVFAAYQLALTYGVLRTARQANNARVRVCLAVYFAFVMASGTFEPDFGSWVRHETAALPFLLVGITGYLGREKDGATVAVATKEVAA